MNANALAWIEALRSDDYAQTTKRLRRRGKIFWQRDVFCAMGVLYDLYFQARQMPWPKESPRDELRAAVLEWAGVSKTLETTVVARNDGGCGFRDLASIIEAHLLREARTQAWQRAAQTVDQLILRAQRSGAAQARSSD